MIKFWFLWCWVYYRNTSRRAEEWLSPNFLQIYVFSNVKHFGVQIVFWTRLECRNVSEIRFRWWEYHLERENYDFLKKSRVWKALIWSFNKCTIWHLKSYRFGLSSVYFDGYHFLTIISISVNTSRIWCNLHANKIFWDSHLSFRLFWNFCSQKSVKMMVNFGSLIFGNKHAVFFVQYLLIPVNFSRYWCKFHLFYVWNIWII